VPAQWQKTKTAFAVSKFIDNLVDEPAGLSSLTPFLAVEEHISGEPIQASYIVLGVSTSFSAN
jgi:hypothetical protein